MSCISMELKALARRIKDRQKAIELCKQKTLEAFKATIAEIVLQGQDLIEAKDHCPHGEWERWVTANTNLSLRTTQIYMRVARHADEIDLEHINSLRKAVAFLADADPHDEATASEPKQPAYLQAIDRCSRLLGWVERCPINQWPEEGKDKLRSDLEPIAKQLWPAKF